MLQKIHFCRRQSLISIYGAVSFRQHMAFLRSFIKRDNVVPSLTYIIIEIFECHIPLFLNRDTNHSHCSCLKYSIAVCICLYSFRSGRILSGHFCTFDWIAGIVHNAKTIFIWFQLYKQSRRTTRLITPGCIPGHTLRCKCSVCQLGSCSILIFKPSVKILSVFNRNCRKLYPRTFLDVYHRSHRRTAS